MTQKIEKYIILGERRNGRFYKAEKIKLDRFTTLMEDCISKRIELKPTLWNKLTGKYNRNEQEYINKFNIEYELIQRIFRQITRVIDHDQPKKKILKK